MKKILILTICSLFLLQSCKDWLDVASSTQFKGDELFETESGFNDALTGIYLNMASTDMYGKNMSWFMVDLMAQPTVSFQRNRVTEIIMNGNYKSATVQPLVDAMWTKSYTTIANINKELNYINEEEGVLNPISKNLLQGELYGLRAFIHFDLLRLYGYGDVNNREDFAERVTIPYVTEYSKDLTPQKTYAETIQLIIADLRKAISFLEQDPIRGLNGEDYYRDINVNGFWNKRQFRMNYFAAKATLARVYMWEGSAESIKNAYDIAQEIIAAEGTAYNWVQYADIASSSDNSIDRVFSKEHLFSMNVYNFKDIVNDYMVDLTYKDEANTPIYEAYDIEYNLFNAYVDNGYYDDDWNYISVIEPGMGYNDYRFSKLLKPTIFNETSYYYCTKLYQSDNTYVDYTNNMPLIRISEMWFIVAEYWLLQEDNQKALDALNVVRAARGMKEPLTIDIIENEWWSTVECEFYKEYIKEFMQEGQLFYLLKRKNIASLEDVGMWLNRTITFSDERYVLPYPEDEFTLGNRVQ